MCQQRVVAEREAIILNSLQHCYHTVFFVVFRRNTMHNAIQINFALWAALAVSSPATA